MTKAITKLIYKHETPPGAPPGGEFIMLVEDKNAVSRSSINLSTAILTGYHASVV